MTDSIFTAEQMETAVRPPTPPNPREDWYVVVAYWEHGPHWKLFRDKWLTNEAAQKEAARLPKGYTHYRIFLVPGEPGQEGRRGKGKAFAAACLAAAKVIADGKPVEE